MIIEIQTNNRQFMFDLLNKQVVSIGDSIDIPGNAKLTWNSSIGVKSVGIPDHIKLILEFGEGVLIEVVANWLYNKLKKEKNNIKTVTINRKTVEIEEGEIKKVIEENINSREESYF